MAGPEAVDFSNGEVPAIINKWVEDQTNSKIRGLIPDLDPDTVLVLVNAIYFKGDWDLEFNDAFEDDFKVSEEKSVKVQMMTNPLETEYGYLKLDEYKAQAVEIPYKGDRISMIVILPDPESSLEELEKSVEEKGLSKILDTNKNNFLISFGRREVDLTLPKFKIETSLDLVTALREMGMTNMFDSAKADFSKMGHPDAGKIYVSDGKKN